MKISSAEKENKASMRSSGNMAFYKLIIIQIILVHVTFTMTLLSRLFRIIHKRGYKAYLRK